jgi:predicted RNase H-like nuclease (RuvC/YqgF family)
MNGYLCGIPIREVLRRYDEFDRLERKVAYLEEIREDLLERVDDLQGEIIHLRQKHEDQRDALIADNRKLRLEKRARGLQLERLMDKLVAASMRIVDLERRREGGKWTHGKA